MIDSSQLLNQSLLQIERARALIDDSKRACLQFVNTELDLGRTFAESALASFSAGSIERAKASSMAAKKAHEAALKYLELVDAEAETLRVIEAKLAELEMLIGKLRVK